MKFWVDARFVNGKPHLRVVDLDSGRVRLDWGLVKTREMLDSGQIPRDVFLKPERYGMQLLVRNLFLLACTEDKEMESRQVNGEAAWRFQAVVRPR